MILVVFDCDGTLVDSQHMIVEAMTRAFEQSRLAPPPRHDVLSVVGLSLAEAIGRLTPRGGPDEILDLCERYKSAFGELRRAPEHVEPLYPGVREALQMLSSQADVMIGMATGKSRRGVHAVLEREKLSHHFATIQTADTNPSKPDPAMLLAAMSDTGGAATRTLMVGDTTYDIDMARAAGARAVGVAWGYHEPAALVKSGAHGVIGASADLGPALMNEISGLRGRL